MIGLLDRSLKIIEPIFIHIPKTGGTSVLSVLGMKNYYAHKTPKRVRQEFGQEFWDSSFKFTFVRNPWDHAVSYYESTKGQIHLLVAYPNFSAWVLGGMLSFPMTDWRTSDEKGSPLLQEQYIQNDMFVGRFENLQQDFDHVCSVIGRPQITLPHKNKGIRDPDYRMYYENDRVREIVASKNLSIIERFGYVF